MSTQLPLRRIRIPALRQQCLFQRHHRSQHLALLQPTTAARAFSSTPSRPAKRRAGLGQDKAQTKAAAQGQVGPSPRVNLEKAQASTDAMAEDIGLLQGTVIRPPLSELWRLGLGGGLKYLWVLIKSKGTGWYGRYVYQNCIVKTGWRRFRPVDAHNKTQITTLAKAHYEQLWLNFANGESKAFKQFCLPPLIKKLESRITARGNLKMEWRLHSKPKARVVSHRAQPLGEEQPDTAYRQVVIRLESTQSLTKTSGKGSTSTTQSGFSRPFIRRELPWIPDSARQRMLAARQRVRKLRDEGENAAVVGRDEFPDNGKPKKVVEYLVMQKRVIRGREEDWKVWGFAEESTPERLEDDEEYWRRTLDLQVSGGA